jgi:hypothetical protein
MNTFLLILALALLGAFVVLMNSEELDDPPPSQWPTVTRIVDGLPTVVQPEDLGR